MSTDVVMSFSSGKDCAYALYRLTQDPDYSVKSLLTTMTRTYNRISMHGIRQELLQQQAQAIGLPLDIVWIEPDSSNEAYQHAMFNQLNRYKQQNLRHIAFGDLFLEDVRSYREKMNGEAGITSLFPIWGTPTSKLSSEIIKQGFKSVVVCVDTKQLDPSFCGREYDENFLQDLPPGVDPCGENGEFHTFCYDGPIFAKPVRFSRGDRVLRDDRFMYQELIPLSS